RSARSRSKRPRRALSRSTRPRWSAPKPAIAPHSSRFVLCRRWFRSRATRPAPLSTAIRTRSPISPMFGHSPATRHHATRTGSLLAPEALTKARRSAAALGVVVVVLSLAPLAVIAARKPQTLPPLHRASSLPPKIRSIPYPRLQWPLEIGGGQYAPV